MLQESNKKVPTAQMDIQIGCICKAAFALSNSADDLTNVHVNIAKTVIFNTRMHTSTLTQDIPWLSYTSSLLHVIDECHSQQCIWISAPKQVEFTCSYQNKIPSDTSINAFYST